MFEWIKRLFHMHKWIAIRVTHYLDTSFDKKGTPSTKATIQCKVCGKIKVKIYYNTGYLTFDELNKWGK